MDYGATTPMDRRVLDEMLPYFTEMYGNAGSRSHAYGWAAETALTTARERVASLLGANPTEIVFTSGGTESCNLAVKGIAEMYQEQGRHIITSSVEHRAVMDPCRHLERQGFEVTYLPVDSVGCIDLDQLEAAIREDTILISVLLANNEIGTLLPAADIGRIAKKRKKLFHLDACLGLDTEVVDVEKMGIDLLSLSGHKIYGPKGIGALYVRRRNPRVRLAPLIEGGGQERGMRHGTANVPGIVGLGKAAQLCQELRAEEKPRITALREKMWTAFSEALDYCHLNGHPTERQAGNLNVSFEFVEGESLIMGCSNLAISSGSACTSSTLEPSHVMRAIGVGEERVHTSIRYSFGRFTTEAEVDAAIASTLRTVHKLRDMSPLYEMVKEGIDLKSVQWTDHH